MRKPLIAGNWKMNKNSCEATEFGKEIAKLYGSYEKTEVLLIPSFTELKSVYDEIKNTAIRLGAQNFYPEKSGAYTGEVSYSQLLAAGCTYVLVGHSERRRLFNESSALLNRKVLVAMEKGLSPILCVGETLEEKESLMTKDIIKTQLKEGLKDVSGETGRYLTIAYEPVWAIGTGKVAQNEDIQQIHAFIRSVIFNLFDGDTAEHIRILYGGSVKPDNIKGIMQQRDVDGVLVGGASLDISTFAKLITFGDN
jgi:triosephosphate isomerase